MQAAHPLLELVLALFLGVPVVGGATLTGNQEALCARMGGVFTPAPYPADVCPGGTWAKLFTTPRPAPRQ